MNLLSNARVDVFADRRHRAQGRIGAGFHAQSLVVSGAWRRVDSPGRLNTYGVMADRSRSPLVFKLASRTDLAAHPADKSAPTALAVSMIRSMSLLISRNGNCGE